MEIRKLSYFTKFSNDPSFLLDFYALFENKKLLLFSDCGKPLTYINETFGMNNTTGTQPIEGRSRRHIRTRDTGCKLGLVAGGVLGGAAVGAGIGTAIVPVIGTMIGGLLGVIGGVVGGRFGAQEFC